MVLSLHLITWRGRRGRDCICSFILQLPVQSVPIKTNVVSSNHDKGDVYSIQLYVIKFISDLQQVGYLSMYGIEE